MTANDDCSPPRFVFLTATLTFVAVATRAGKFSPITTHVFENQNARILIQVVLQLCPAHSDGPASFIRQKGNSWPYESRTTFITPYDVGPVMLLVTAINAWM